jgi:cation:H+ antiporter
LLNLGLVVAGIVALTIGGEAVVRGALSVARRIGVSPLLAGLVIVGFGTSAPELVVSIDAARSGHPDIAVGNVVGSNVSNVLLIMSICALLRPLATTRAMLIRDAMTMTGASFLFTVLLWGRPLDRLDGSILLAALLAYLIWSYWTETYRDSPSGTLHRSEAEAAARGPQTVPLMLLAMAGGLALLVVGSQLLLTGAIALARDFGISEALIGLTLVAVGTSLPELAVCAVATLRKQPDIALGNLIGSCIFNLLGVLGVVALMHPLPVAERIAEFDQWVMLSAAVLVTVLLHTNHCLTRLEAALLLTGYAAYVVVSYALFS